MKKKILLYILIFAVSIISVFLIISPKKSEDKQTVVFWTLQLSTFDKYINKIIDEFEAQNPDIKIKWIDIPYSEGEKRTLASILTDNPPDLVNTTPDFSMLLAQKNALYNVSDEDLSQFVPAVKETLKYNNQYFGIPFYATSAVTLYNENLTRKLNIDKIPVTYGDLFELPFENNESYFLTMIAFSENDTLLKILNKYGINSPALINGETSIRLFKEFKLMYDNGKIPGESVTQTHRDALEKYMAGQLVYLVTGANFINMIRENAPAVYKNTKVSAQLTGSTKLYDYSLMNFIIPKKAKNPQTAIKFALFLTNEQNQLEFAKLTTILPVNKETLQDGYFKRVDNSDIQAQARIISSMQLNNLQMPLPNVKNKKELNTISSNSIQEILINNAPIKETLDKFSTSWQKLY